MNLNLASMEEYCCFFFVRHLTGSIAWAYSKNQAEAEVMVSHGESCREHRWQWCLPPCCSILRRPQSVTRQGNCRSPTVVKAVCKPIYSSTGATEKALLLTSQLENSATAEHRHKMADCWPDQCMISLGWLEPDQNLTSVSDVFLLMSWSWALADGL